MKAAKFLLLSAITAGIAAFFLLDWDQYLRFASLQTWQSYYQANPWHGVGFYFAVYLAATALPLPGGRVVLGLAGGAVFGLWIGTLLVSFSATLGATLSFLLARYWFRELVQKRFAEPLKSVNAGVEKDGVFYLFTLRLVPLFPFTVSNSLMGLTAMRAWKFAGVSQIGMLAETVVYVNAGAQIGKLDSLSGVASPILLLSLALPGIFPLVAKTTVGYMQNRKALRGYRKPKHFNRNLIVIGGGSAGLVSAYIAATVKAKVTLIEKHRMGGDCLNTGCVPSKALIAAARFLAQSRRATKLGFTSAQVEFDFKNIMERVQRIIKTVEPHDSVARYTRLGVECLHGKARLVSPYEVEINGQIISARNIIIATGARPFVPDIPGLREGEYYTSDTIWNLRELPKRLVVVGGGPIACELAQCFARFGSQVSIVQRRDRLLPKEDPEFSHALMQRFRDEGLDLRLQHQPVAVRGKVLVCGHESGEVVLPFDILLLCVGRKANTAGFGLEALGVELTPQGHVAVNAYLQSNIPTLYACGDVAGPYQFTHSAAHQAWYAAVNSLFGDFKRFAVDYSVIPWATFTEPEIARVGLNEQEARQQNIAYEVSRFDLAELDRAIADEEAYGMVKVLSVPGKDKILGVTVAGSHAGEMIAEYISAMRHGLGLNKILGTIHIYPTLTEANKYAAGVWKRAHKPESLLIGVERFHAWRRGH